ncbi:hypothetical protein EB796_009612 [Bugula neritina]|uniref:Uncharacterized protein n=1 Tax=Bugula neritina TaxID=10212 RepID=A0A7J7K0G7_BUGNE|nr:hypothetical protein EB796_009612 [Bugula neritina]
MSSIESQGKETAAASKTLDEEVDIDLTDPEVEKAALKIQAQFKGLKANKKKNSSSKQDCAIAFGESMNALTILKMTQSPVNNMLMEIIHQLKVMT